MYERCFRTLKINQKRQLPQAQKIDKSYIIVVISLFLLHSTNGKAINTTLVKSILDTAQYIYHLNALCTHPAGINKVYATVDYGLMEFDWNVSPPAGNMVAGTSTFGKE